MTLNGNHDIHRLDSSFEAALGVFKKSDICQSNKGLILEFLNDMAIGWTGCKKVGKFRQIKYLQTLEKLTKMLEITSSGFLWPFIQKPHVKMILVSIDNNQAWGDWSKHAARTIMKKFVTWLRKEHGYPAGYPDNERLNNILQIVKYPSEVDYNTPHPKKLKPINEIPTEYEVTWLIQAWVNYGEKSGRVEEAARNTALIAILSEVGIRISGLGNLQIKDVTFDTIGAKISVTDKTMIGEPVRLITSVPYLKAWLNHHPAKDDLNAPLTNG